MKTPEKQVKPKRSDYNAADNAMAPFGLPLVQRRALAQLIADAREHGYSGHEECGYNTCKCSACVAAEVKALR